MSATGVNGQKPGPQMATFPMGIQGMPGMGGIPSGISLGGGVPQGMFGMPTGMMPGGFTGMPYGMMNANAQQQVKK